MHSNDGYEASMEVDGAGYLNPNVNRGEAYEKPDNYYIRPYDDTRVEAYEKPNHYYLRPNGDTRLKPERAIPSPIRPENIAQPRGERGNYHKSRHVYNDIEPMSIAEPQKSRGQPINGILCTRKKLCFVVIAVSILVVVSCIAGGVGAFYGVQGAATTNKALPTPSSLTTQEATSVILTTNAPACTPNKPCQNNGQCMDIGNGQYRCSCVNNYFGTNCEYNCQFSQPPCRNQGACNSDIQTQTNQPCSCFNYHSGQFCEKTSACTPNNPCQNNGQCSEFGDGFYDCSCVNNYFGINCEYSCTFDNPCLNNGQCIGFGYNEYRCSCVNNFIGTDCEYHCQFTPPPCQNGGICSSTTQYQPCICPDNYIGQFCEISIAECSQYNPCLNNGECRDIGNGQYRCSCVNNVFGNHCEYNCQFSPPLCHNGGTCNSDIQTQTNQSCICLGNYIGQFCEKRPADESIIELDINGASTRIYSPGFPGFEYPNYANEHWIFTADSGVYFLFLNVFETEDDHDKLIIGTGETPYVGTQYVLYGVLTGTGQPAYIIPSSNMWLVFTSDEIRTRPGFDIEVSLRSLA